MRISKSKASEVIQWVANRIYKKFYLTKGGNFVNYTIDDNEKDKNAPSYYDQVDVLGKMEWGEAITIHQRKFKHDLSKSGDESNLNYFEIEIIQPKFDELYGRFIEESERVMKSSEDTVPEVSVGSLALFNDGTIRYRNEILPLRKQLKDLCRLFLESPNRLITYDTIRDEIVRADRRSTTSYTSISKYVSELHNVLKSRFGKKVFTNLESEGWYFKP